jgi:cyclic pyranopterin phosphate synthase
MNEFTHFNDRGEARMVDVGDKPVSRRTAVAGGRIRMQPETLARLERGEHGKGDVLAVARVAGVMGSKRTADLVPLCHAIALSRVEVTFAFEPSEADPAVACQATAETTERTGVEMEALTALQVALLTIYDMCKSVDRGMTLDGIGLLDKSGGRSGHWQRNEP